MLYALCILGCLASRSQPSQTDGVVFNLLLLIVFILPMMGIVIAMPIAARNARRRREEMARTSEQWGRDAQARRAEQERFMADVEAQWDEVRQQRERMINGED